MSSHRAIIFDRVKNALEKGAREKYIHPQDSTIPIPPELPEALIRETKSENLVALFQKQVELLSDHFIAFENTAVVKDWLEKEITRRGFKKGIADSDVIELLNLQNSSSVIPPGNREGILRCDFGVTIADFAIAETGSIAQVSKEGCSRLTSLTPEVHYAIVTQDKLLADVLDAITFQKNNFTGKSLVWISGSSRTADIDGILIQGAHGPKELQILFVDQEKAL